MNKMNKKGFTLIEMLVVIAIIAVLVAIIVPIVGSSTDKAACATNAANLRSTAASISVAYLNGDITGSGDVTSQLSTAGITAPTYKSCSVGSATFKAEIVDGEVKCTFGGSTVQDFADGAAS